MKRRKGMKKQKTRVLKILLSIALGCFSLGLLGCGDNGSSESSQASQGIAYGDITFVSQTVDVADAPDFVVEIGENKINKVLVDGVALPINHYLVKNGYFAFAYDNFYEMGLGVHNVEVVFEQGSKQFTITVTDVQDPEFSIAVEASYDVGDRTLPKAKRLNDYQAYDLSYALTKDGVDVPMTDEGDGLSVIRGVLRGAARILRDGGLLLMEFGAEQGMAVLSLAREYSFCDVHILKDAAGHDRVLVARRGF
jgi:hypothetical protein